MKVEVPTGNVQMGPVGYALYSSQFSAAGRAARAVPDNAKFSPVPYYLYCRALELILKAYLLTKGWTVDKLKNDFGHDLTDLMGEARREGLEDVVGSLPATIDDDLEVTNDYYDNPIKAFEYFNFEKWWGRYEDLPPLDRLESSTELLVEKLKPYCLSQA